MKNELLNALKSEGVKKSKLRNKIQFAEKKRLQEKRREYEVEKEKRIKQAEFRHHEKLGIFQ